MNTIAQGIKLMKSDLEQHCNGGSWHNQCGRFVCRFVTGADASGGGLGASRDTAWEAHLASGPILSTNHARAPAGAIGWYRGRGDDPKPGHVVVHLGNDQLAMASDAVTTSWGNCSGTCSWDHYQTAKPAMEYVGWSYDFVGQVLKDAKIVVKRRGKPELYLLTSPTTRHHLTPQEWAPLKASGVHYAVVRAASLGQFALAV